MNLIRSLRIQKVIVIGILLTLLCEVIPVSNCSAATEEYTLTYSNESNKSFKESELLQEFQENSNQVKQIKENYSLKNIKAQIAEQTKNQAGIQTGVISSSFNTYNQMKTELECAIDILQAEYAAYLKSEKYEELTALQYRATIQDYQSQLVTVNQQISSLNESYASANTQYNSYALEADLEQFYITNKELCEQGEINQLLYDFYDTVLSLIVLKEQGKYYDCYKSYLQTQEKVEKIKMNNGLSTMLNVSDIQATITTTDAERDEIESSYQSVFTSIYDEIGQENINIAVDLNDSKKSFNSTKIIQTLLKENITYLQLENTIQVYRDYLFTGDISGTLQHQQITELISSYETQKVMLEKSIERYVESMIKTYDQAVTKLHAIANSGNVLEQQYEVVKEQYNHGRATLLDVTSIECKRYENKVNYYQTMTKKMRIEYILEHWLYGIEVIN